jgi:hypothetical protein
VGARAENGAKMWRLSRRYACPPNDMIFLGSFSFVYSVNKLILEDYVE